MRCEDCNKGITPTWTDKLRLRIMYFLFRNDLAELTSDKYTKGFGEGYKQGFKDYKDISTVVPRLQAIDPIKRKDFKCKCGEVYSL